MDLENKLARFMRNSGPARFFVPVGLILIVFGILTLGMNTKDYSETTGRITSVVECVREQGEEQQYDVTVKYTVDGREYENTFANITGNYSVGNDTKVYYDPADPQKSSNVRTSGLMSPLLIIIGAAALAFGVYKSAKAFGDSKELDRSVQGGGAFPHGQFDGFKEARGVTEYYFRFDGNHLKPGFVIEDADRQILYEGKMIKQALVGSRIYEFTDHTTGDSREHEVGHPVSQTYNDEFFTVRSWFKFDGRNVWDILHGQGLRINTDMHSKFPYLLYNVARNGRAFARIETSGVHVHEDDAARHKVNIPSGSYYYRFWTASDDFETLFLTIFSISLVDQAVVE